MRSSGKRGMVSPADGEDPHCVCRRPLGKASRKQTNNLISVICKCVNTSAWKPICQRLNYGIEALMKAVERWCPMVVSLRSESGHPTHVSVKHWFPERARQALRASPPPNLPLGAPCFQREPPPSTALHPRTSFVSETLAMLEEAPAPPGATFFFREIVNTGETAARK